MLARSSVIALMSLLLEMPCEALSPREQKIVGTWQYATMDAVGRMTFDTHHRVTLSFALDDSPHVRWHAVADGPWRLDGSRLIWTIHPYPIPGYAPTPDSHVEDEIVRLGKNEITFKRGSPFKRVR